ncbi:hypothetical protein [Streptomyces viridochromogenes]|uniref:hypothetical protein n=1 Tax=Streptomyces viridochromogenes TaxID=1938 RepID=UPI00069D918A|nr:hypothetical protein [Streptomyces viridochromogenes]KOG21791.1 hypothetical protein ADK36_12500 [Streptomyces viridochromogenes]
MSEAVQQLTSRQIADLHRQFRERDAQGLGTVLRNLPAPPLPRCPACDAEAERVDQRVEDAAFGVDETALRLRWLPCGHRFRAVVDLDAGPVRPDEEPTT